MKNIKISNITLVFLLLSFLCGFIKDALIIFLIVIIHELGHSFFSKIFNYKINSINIYPFGGITNYENKINSNSYKDLLIFLGGIIFNLLIYLIVYLINKTNIFSIYTYNLFLKYNTSIILFNLLPIIPLDGYLIFNYFFNKVVCFRYSYYISFIVSIIFLIIFILINYIYKIDNYMIICFLIYKLVMYLKDYKYIYHKFLLERYLYNLSFKKIVKERNIRIKNLYKNRHHYFFIDNNWVDEREIIAKIFDK